MLALINPWHGKISRTHWWLSQIAIFCIAIAGLFLTIILFADLESGVETRRPMENVGLAVTILLMIYMNFSVCLNRLRDSGRSGLWYVTFLLPTVGTGLMIYFCGIEKGTGRFVFDRPDDPDQARAPAPPPVQQRQRREFGRRNSNAA